MEHPLTIAPENPGYDMIVPGSVMNDSRIPPAVKFCYGTIRRLCRKEGFCWASNSYLAKENRTTGRTIQRWIKLLEKTGHISVQHDPSNANMRRIRLSEGMTPMSTGTTPETPPRTSKVSGHDTSDAGGMTPVSPKYSNLKNKRTSTGAFEQFWSKYPKKKAKQAALNAFLKIKPDATLLDQMLSAIDKQIRSPEWKKDSGQFIPHPATWLNQGRWEDETLQDRRSAGMICKKCNTPATALTLGLCTSCYYGKQPNNNQ